MLRICLVCIFTLLVFFDTLNARAQTDSTDIESQFLRDDFMTVSLLIVSPGNKVYSWLGHCALRMECPAYRFDYCFTFQMSAGDNITDYLRFFSGHSPAGIFVKNTDQYLKDFQDEGRGVVQYTLNMNPQQKLEMWRWLDKNVKEGFSTQFDFLFYNCTSMSFYTIKNQMLDEHLEVKQWPETMTHSYINFVLYATRHMPWMQFMLPTIMGTKADGQILMEQRLCPEVMGEVMTNAVIVSADGSERPVLLGDPLQLIPQTFTLTSSWLTPLLLSVLLLVTAVLCSLCQWLLDWGSVVRIVDISLLVVQALLGTLLLYLVMVSGLFGQHWNWCLLIISPLPLIMWVCCRRRAWYHYLTLFYGGMLLLMAIAAPLITTQLITPHRIIAAAIAIRCLSCAMRHILKDSDSIPHNLSLHN